MASLTLFLVDGYLLTRISTKMELEQSGDFEITGDFQNAQECLCAIEENCPDIVLLDIELPDMNGIEVCKIIKEKYFKTKVVILTTYEDDSKVLAALSCGACGYVIKGRGDIIKAIKYVASGNLWIELDLALKAFSRIPSPNTYDLENLYKYDELKQNLTKRELEVLKLIIEGKTNNQIAQEIVVSTNTAKAHVGSILDKFGVQDRVQAAVMAVRANLF